MQFEKDLLDIRARMLDINERYNKMKNDEIAVMERNPAKYDGPAVEFNDPKQLKEIKKREDIAQKEIAGW